MENFLSLDAIYVALVFLVPGYVISSCRSHFIVGQKLDGHDYIVRLLTLSALNFTLSGWTIYLAIAWEWSPELRVVLWVVVLGVCPALIGIVSGLSSKAGWVRKLYAWMGFSPVHVVPTSWEYRFSTLIDAWVFVVLKDGTTFAGYWGGKSFASSRSDERDLFIEQVFEVPEAGPWIATNKSVLISGGEIRTIEFTPTR